MAPKKARKTDPSTEEKIKNAARVVFHQKGYAATRTRDIVEKAGINLALLNYYFRSKQKLFDLIMLETVKGFFEPMRSVFYDKDSSLEAKIETLTNRYIDLLIEEPEIPLFIISEIRANPEGFLRQLDLREILVKSDFIRQYREGIAKAEIAPQNLLHFIMNVLGLTVFPFVASPMLKPLGNLSNEQFQELMLERKKLIPKWMNSILKAG